jgi:hypothetical protein
MKRLFAEPVTAHLVELAEQPWDKASGMLGLETA